MLTFEESWASGRIDLMYPRTGWRPTRAFWGEWLKSEKDLDSLRTHLAEDYDLVVLDSPALDSVSDARVLAHLADATVFVVQWESTPRQTALGSLRQLVSAGAQIAGVALHKVNLRKHAKYYRYGYDELPMRG